MTPKELAEYIKVCKKHGVTEFVIGNVRVTLDPSYKPPSAKRPPSSETKDDPKIEGTYTEDEVLMWSVQ